VTYQLYWALVGAAILLAVIGAGVGAFVGVRAWRRQRARTRVVVTLPDGERRNVSLSALDVAGVDAVTTRSVDQILIGNIQDTGLTTPIKRYTFDLEITWTTSDGAVHHHGPATYVWPNDLADVPLSIVKQWGVDLVIQAVRWRLGVDPVPEA